MTALVQAVETTEEFAARRLKSLDELEAALGPVVRRALDTYTDTSGWTEVLAEVRRLWKKTYADETGLKAPQLPQKFIDQLHATLKQASRAGDTTVTAERTTRWLATAILGHSLVTAADDDPTNLLVEWHTMKDGKVRDTHLDVHGTRIEPGEMFTVGAHKMPYPGYPGVPTELWINCRCVLRVILAEAAEETETMSPAPVTDTFVRLENLNATVRSFISEKPWDGSASRFTDEQWKRACILHRCQDMKKSCHSLPIREPGGALSRAAVHAAAGRLGQTSGPAEAKAAAKRALRGAYKQLGEEPPESLAAGLRYVTADEVRAGNVEGELVVVDAEGHATPVKEWVHASGWRTNFTLDPKASSVLFDGFLTSMKRTRPDLYAEFTESLADRGLPDAEADEADDAGERDGNVPKPKPDPVDPPEPSGVTHAGLAVYTHDTNRVLMIQRSLDQTDPPDVQGTWEFPGGGLEEGETSVQAAEREFCEETGLPVPEGEYVGTTVSGNGIYELHVLLVETEKGAFGALNPDLEAADRVNPDDPERRNPDVSAWFTIEQIQNLGPALRPECRKTDWSVFDLEEDRMTTQTTEPREISEAERAAIPEVAVALVAGVEAPVTEWHSVWTVEGERSGDGRRFTANSLTMRPLPLPIGWQKQSDEGHKGNYTVGKATRIARVADEIRASGTYLNTVEAGEAIAMIAEFGKFGISIDADSTVMELNEAEECVDFSEARGCGATIVPIPAFHRAWIANGPPPADFYDGGEDLGVPVDEAEALVASQRFADVAPGVTEDGPGWLTHPVDTDRLRDYWVRGEGAAEINWGVAGDFKRCEAALAPYVKPQYLAGYCANRHKDALGVWPGQEASARDVLTDTDPAPMLSLVASAGGSCAPSEWFNDPEFFAGDPRMVQAKDGTWGAPLTITADGEVWCHIAKWNCCHGGFSDRCIIAPRSQNGYADFLLGAVLTDEGTIPCGSLTIGGGHADVRMGLRAAQEHYDNSTAAWADVNVGEDKFGIWAHGWVRPGTSEAMIHAARASKISGDWRPVGRGRLAHRELIAALSVNVPGYAVPRVAASTNGDELGALVASGMVLEDGPTQRAEQANVAGLDMHALAVELAKEVAGVQARQARLKTLQALFRGSQELQGAPTGGQ